MRRLVKKRQGNIFTNLVVVQRSAELNKKWAYTPTKLQTTVSCTSQQIIEAANQAAQSGSKETLKT